MTNIPDPLFDDAPDAGVDAGVRWRKATGEHNCAECGRLLAGRHYEVLTPLDNEWRHVACVPYWRADNRHGFFTNTAARRPASPPSVGTKTWAKQVTKAQESGRTTFTWFEQNALLNERIGARTVTWAAPASVGRKVAPEAAALVDRPTKATA